MAARLDFVARAEEIAQAGQPAVKLIVGADVGGFLERVRHMREALTAHYDDGARTDLVVIDGMAHALADEPGIDPAPQTPAAREVGTGTPPRGCSGTSAPALHERPADRRRGARPRH